MNLSGELVHVKKINQYVLYGSRLKQHQNPASYIPGKNICSRPHLLLHWCIKGSEREQPRRIVTFFLVSLRGRRWERAKDPEASSTKSVSEIVCERDKEASLSLRQSVSRPADCEEIEQQGERRIVSHQIWSAVFK